MNAGSSDQAVDSVINVDIDWTNQFFAGQKKPGEPGPSSSTMEMELSIFNTANQRSPVITAPAINTGTMGFYDLAAATKSEPEMRRVAVSLINSRAGNISALNKFPSAFPGRQWAAAAASGLSCRGGAVKVKNRRDGRSRCVPTQVVKTDTSNFKAMVQHFTGIPHTTTSSDESTLALSASSYSPQCISSPSFTSFRKPLPQSAVCKISNSSTASKTTTLTATTACASPVEFSLTHLPISDPAALHKHRGQYKWL